MNVSTTNYSIFLLHKSDVCLRHLDSRTAPVFISPSIVISNIFRLLRPLP